MSLDTIYLANADHNGEPIAYMLQRGFERLEKNGLPIPDAKTGADVWIATVLVPGAVNFGLDDHPETVTLKVVGGPNPNLGELTPIRFEGRVMITAWYSKQRGQGARSDLTINAERVAAAPGIAPRVRGGMPAAAPDISAIFLGQHGYESAERPGECDVLFAPNDIMTVKGAGSIACASPVPADLIGADVRPVGLRAYFSAPDAVDVSATRKSRLILACSHFERRVATNNGRTNRKPEPVGAPDAPAEG